MFICRNTGALIVEQSADHDNAFVSKVSQMKSLTPAAFSDIPTRKQDYFPHVISACTNAHISAVTFHLKTEHQQFL